MIVITAHSGDDGKHGTEYSEIIAHSKANAEKFGHRFYTFTYPQGIQDKRYHWKPRALRAAITIGEPVVYLDGDALIVRPFDLPDDFDIGLCVRGTRNRPARLSKNCINAGVIFARNRISVMSFTNAWMKQQETDPNLNDQHHLNLMLKERYNTLAPGDRIQAYGANIRIFSCKLYNSWYWRRWPEFGGTTQPYILHFKRSVRRKYKEWKEYDSRVSLMLSDR